MAQQRRRLEPRAAPLRGRGDIAAIKHDDDHDRQNDGKTPTKQNILLDKSSACSDSNGAAPWKVEQRQVACGGARAIIIIIIKKIIIIIIRALAK